MFTATEDGENIWKSRMPLYAYIAVGTLVWQFLAGSVFVGILGWPESVSFFIPFQLFLLGAFPFNRGKPNWFAGKRPITFKFWLVYSTCVALILSGSLALFKVILNIVWET